MGAMDPRSGPPDSLQFVAGSSQASCDQLHLKVQRFGGEGTCKRCFLFARNRDAHTPTPLGSYVRCAMPQVVVY